MKIVKNRLPANNQIKNNGFYYLNLGKYKEQCNVNYLVDSNTAYQRPIIILSILNSEDTNQNDIKESVAKTLEHLPGELKPSCYSTFEFTT